LTKKGGRRKIYVKMETQFKQIPLDLIDPPSNPARMEPSDEEVQQLADSIATTLLINPLTVFAKNGRYEVSAGHRRYLACKLAKKETVPCIVIENIDNLARTIMLTENVQRRDMSPIEEAAQIAELQELNNWGYKVMAAHIGKSVAWVQARVALLNLPPDLTLLVHQRTIGINHAFELARVTDENTRKTYTREALQAGSSIATIRMWADMWEHAQQTPNQGNPYLQDNPFDQPTPEHLMLCQTCEGKYRIHDLRTLILCKDCLRIIMEVKRGNSPDTFGIEPGGGDRHPNVGDQR
jgi:ParB family chromosome partitioning protein